MAETAVGAVDAEVMRIAQAERRLLLTGDKDFDELVFRSRMAVPGVVLLRIDPEKHSLKWQSLQQVIGRFGEALIGRYVVVEAARFRSRPLLQSIPR